MIRYEVCRPDEASRQAAMRRWDSAAKPLRSLGAFEPMVAQLAAIRQTPDVRVGKSCVRVFCADNGVGSEGADAVLLFPMLDAALAVYQGTHTFGSLGMDAYTEQEGTK